MRAILFASASLLLHAGCTNERGIRRIQRAPDVEIIVPELDQAFRKGEPVVFSGAIVDSYDSPTTLVATWTLDDTPTVVPILTDGGVVLDVDTTDLELGEHLITLHGRDSDGMFGEFEVPWILLGESLPPVVAITGPANGSAFEAYEEITFRGEATDNNTDPDDLTFQWTSSINGELQGAISGDGQSVLFDSTLSLGTHLITLDAMDIDGLLGSDAIEVTVGAEVDPAVVEAQVGDVVFSEILVQPLVVTDEQGEWVELYNASNGTIDLDSYAFHDLDIDTYTIAGTLLVAPDSYAVLCANTDSAQNGGIPCDGWFLRETGGEGAMALGNNGDEVVLSRPDGVVIDEVIYTSSWFEPGIAKGVDPTVLNADNNDDESMWCHQATVISGATEPGTPGLPNDACP